MKTRTDSSTCEFGAGVLLTHLQAFQQEIEGVRQARDIEHIHRMRVASRRLRNALTLFGDCYPPALRSTWQKEIRRMARALSAGRDTDVQMELVQRIYRKIPDKKYQPGIHRLLIRLRQQRQDQQEQILKALDKLEKSGTLDQITRAAQKFSRPQGESGFSQALYQLAFSSITERLEELISYEPFIEQPERVEELHAMRIAAKHLRYTLETFAPLYASHFKDQIKALRTIQEMLGDIHDCDVWTAHLPQFIETERQRTIEYYGIQSPFNRLLPGIQYFLQDRLTARNNTYLDFLRAWKGWKEENLWQKLIQTVEIPLRITAEVQPSFKTSDV